MDLLLSLTGSYGYHTLLQLDAKIILSKVYIFIAVHNRTVNLEGKPGQGKPIDQMTEHYIL